MSSSSDNQLAFTGHIANTLDALLIFEACRRGILPRTQNRLSEIERAKIKSGDVYVFGEEESKIKRWTDGRRWSPSRIMNNFLIYRELEPTEKELKKSAPLIPANTDTDSRDEVADTSSAKDKKIKREESQIQFGNDMFNEPPSSITTIAAVKVKISQIPLPGIVLQGGLIKKTISVGGLHMISYYCPADIKDGSLKTPSSVDTLASLEINHIFLLARYFRHPPQVAFGEDGTPRFVALTDDDPMPRKPGAASYPKKVKQEATSTSSSRQDELVRPSSSSTAAGRDMSGPSYFPKMEPEDDIFPEHFGPSESTSSDLPSPPPPLPMTNRRSSTGYSAGSRYRSVPGLARSLSSASESTTTAAGEILDHPPSMRPRTGSSGGGHRHEPYRMPMSRGSSNTSSSTIHPHHPSYKSPRHSFSMEYSPTMQHLRQQRTDIMYTEGIGRHLRSASLSSGLGSVSRRESMTSSPSIHAQVNAANASVTGAVPGATSPEPSLGQQSPYFGSQHSHNTYSPYMVQQRPYTSPHGGLPEQSWQGEYMGSDANTAQMYAFPPSASSAMEQQYSTEEDNQRRMSMAYSPTMQAQSPWLEHHGGDIPYTHPSLQHPREQYGLSDTGMYFMAPQQSSADFGLAATSALPPQQQHQAESVFVSGQQPYPLGEFIQPHEGGNMARNAVFQYYPPTALSSSISSQHTIPLLRTEFSPLMPASASYPSSLSSHHQQSEEASNMPYDQVPEDQQHAGLGLLAPAPPSYPHQPPHQQQQVSYPANLGKVKIDYKVVEPVTWPSYTSPKGAHHHHYHQPQHQQLQLQGVHPSELHPEQPDIS